MLRQYRLAHQANYRATKKKGRQKGVRWFIKRQGCLARHLRTSQQDRGVNTSSQVREYGRNRTKERSKLFVPFRCVPLKISTSTNIYSENIYSSDGKLKENSSIETFSQNSQKNIFFKSFDKLNFELKNHPTGVTCHIIQLFIK